MKKVIVLLAIIGSICSISCTKERVNVLSSIHDGFDPMYMYGKIQEVIVTSEYMIDTIKLDNNGKVIQKGHRHYSYDANGVLISQHAGSHIKTEYIYDGDILVASKFYRNNTLQDIWKYYYNEQNQIISKKWYYEDELNTEIQYEYNDNGNIVCERELNYSISNNIYSRLGYKTNPLSTHTIYLYDKNGNIIKEEWYNNHELEQSTKFEYDKRGNVIYKEMLDYDDVEKVITKYSYEYDRKGNWIKREETQNNETNITTRNIIYY